MQHDTYVVKQSFLQWLHKRSNPLLVVNLCFIVVLIFSTLLTWREVVVLEEAYISSQRNHLETVASSLDRQLQFSVNKMLYFRHSMLDALETPLAFGVLQDAVKRFERVRRSPSGKSRSIKSARCRSTAFRMRLLKKQRCSLAMTITWITSSPPRSKWAIYCAWPPQIHATRSG